RRREQAVLPVHADGRDNHHRQHQRRAEGAKQSKADQGARGKFCQPRTQRKRPAGAKADRFEEATSAGEPVPAKPSEQFLRAVRRHQRAEHEAADQQSSIHSSPPMSHDYIKYSYYVSSSNLPLDSRRGILGEDARES